MKELRLADEFLHKPADIIEPRIKDSSSKKRKALINRLNRIEGQIRGIKGMIEKSSYCDDVLHQISAVESAMKSISKLILEEHMKSCLVTRVQSGDTEVVDELLNTIEKIL